MHHLSLYLQAHPSTKTSYVSIMNHVGLSVHPAQIRWYTSGLNRTFVRLGTTRPRFLHAWFSAGVVFGCIAMVASQTLLVLIVLNLLSPQPVEQQVLVPVVSMLAHGLNDFFALRFGLS
jgi:S2P endopeptidase